MEKIKIIEETARIALPGTTGFTEVKIKVRENNGPKGEIPLGFKTWSDYDKWFSEQNPPAQHFNYNAT